MREDHKLPKHISIANGGLPSYHLQYSRNAQEDSSEYMCAFGYVGHIKMLHVRSQPSIHSSCVVSRL